ncbi:MAG: methionyl-tRNA formyltransferase [Cyanobacteriota bacterium]|nr:methionyl-tRNA formyltransferase [Cyanobacteriota bacterium]
MRLVFFGTPEFAVPSLHRLAVEPDFHIVGVVTQPDQRRGRGSQVDASPVKQAALPLGCPVLQPERLKHHEPTLTSLDQLQADAFVVVAYGQLLSPQLLAIPRLGCINGHGSLLPAYRGAAPIQWAIVKGETHTGITTIQMDPGMDTGAMLLKSYLAIGLLDNFPTVAASLAQQCADLLVETLRGLDSQQLTPEPQNPDLATYAPLLHKQDYGMDWQRPAIALHNQVRGFYPHCVTHFRGQPLKLLATVPLGEAYWSRLPSELAPLVDRVSTLEVNAGASPGTVVALLKGYGPVVQTGEGFLLLQQVKPSGKQLQQGGDFINGSRLQLGEVIGAFALS